MIGCNAEMSAQGGLKEKTALWKLDCERSGQSGTNVSVATGITAAVLTLLGAVSGYAACRVWLLCLCAPVSRLAKPWQSLNSLLPQRLIRSQHRTRSD